MPRMHCMGTSVEIPENGQICPKLPTNMVPSGTKCEIACNSGSPNLEYIKCETEGWTSTDVYCSGTSPGLIVALLVGGVIVVVIIAYVYARMKMRKKNKAQANAAGPSLQPISRAAKIAARNDMMVTGVVTSDAVKSGLIKPAASASRKQQGKLVTGAPQDADYRHPSSSSQASNPPSYHSVDPNDERSRNSTPTSKSGKSRRSRNSNSEYPPQRKQQQYYDEYAVQAELGHHEVLPIPAMDGQYHTMQDTGPMYPDYYGPGVQRNQHRYGALDHNYYKQDVGTYPDQYLSGGVDNMVYGHAEAYQKPYRVPI